MVMRPTDVLLQILIFTLPGSTEGNFWSKVLIWRTIECENRNVLILSADWVLGLSLMCLVLMGVVFGKIWHAIKPSQTVDN